MGVKNIIDVLKMADEIDIREGKEAYPNYNILCRKMAEYYSFGFVQTVAAFVSLSPNNSYIGTVRSMASLMWGVNHSIPVEKIIMSTYRHCLIRAFNYLTGQKDFLVSTTGPKIINFYHNILDPTDARFVTVDGHMHNVWANCQRPMKHSLVTGGLYPIIVNDVKKVAKSEGMIPNQVQSIIWFTWKRINKIVYDPQTSLFGREDDYWGLKLDPKDIKPF